MMFMKGYTPEGFKFEFNRDSYTDAKTDFIRKVIKLAKEKMRNKYQPL